MKPGLVTNPLLLVFDLLDVLPMSIFPKPNALNSLLSRRNASCLVMSLVLKPTISGTQRHDWSSFHGMSSSTNVLILLYHQNPKSTSQNSSGMVSCLEMILKASHKWETHGINWTQTLLLHLLHLLIPQLIQLLTLMRTVC